MLGVHHSLYFPFQEWENDEKKILNNIQKSSILALAYYNVLFLCIFFHSHVYMMENIPSEKAETCRFLTFFFFFFVLIGHQSPGCAVKVECVYLPFGLWFF